VIEARMIKEKKFRDWIEKIVAVLINSILGTFGRLTWQAEKAFS
jgi:hypothetical protein